MWLWFRSVWLGITSFEQLKWHLGKRTESSSESPWLQDCSPGLSWLPEEETQLVNLPHCAEHTTPLVSLSLSFHYFFFAYKSYFWSARHIFTEGIVNIRFIQLCVILNPLYSPGKKQDHSSEHFNKQAKTLNKKKRTDRKKRCYSSTPPIQAGDTRLRLVFMFPLWNIYCQCLVSN